MSSFSDHFSGVAREYSAYRPTYPSALVEFLANVSPARTAAWEAGCGSGQFTRLLATRFQRVIATDASASQLAQAPPISNVDYQRAPAESVDLDDGSIDLCVAAQAAHWFDLDAYYQEVRRVGKADSAIALITYGLHRIADDVDAIIDRFYETDLEPHWPVERRLVAEGYSSITFPFEEVDVPPFEMSADWALDDVLGYIRTWSAVQRLLASEGPELWDKFSDELVRVWGTRQEKRSVRWPLSVRAGVIHG